MMLHLLLAVAMTALPAAWPMYQWQPNHQAVFDDTAAPVAWQRPLPGKVNGGLAVVGGVVYVESFDRRLYALDARSGAVRWSAPLENIAMTTPIIGDGVVIAGTGSNAPLVETPAQTIWGRKKGDAVVAFSRTTGALVWRFPTVGEDMPTPALVRVGGVPAIVFANGDNHLRALRLRDGKQLWTLPTQGISTMSSMAAVGNTIYAISGVPVPGPHHDELYAVNAATGAYLWRAPVGNADCSPTVADGMVFVEGSGSDSRRPEYSADFNDVVAVDAVTGHVRWSWRSGWGYLTPTASHEQAIAGLEVGGVLYQSIPATSEFAAFDVHRGHLLWKIPTDEPVKMSAVFKNGKLYFGDTGQTFYVLDAASGKVVGGRSFSSYFTPSPPVIVGSTLYVVNDSTVYAMPLSAL